MINDSLVYTEGPAIVISLSIARYPFTSALASLRVASLDIKAGWGFEPPTFGIRVY